MKLILAIILISSLSEAMAADASPFRHFSCKELSIEAARRFDAANDWNREPSDQVEYDHIYRQRGLYLVPLKANAMAPADIVAVSFLSLYNQAGYKQCQILGLAYQSHDSFGNTKGNRGGFQEPSDSCASVVTKVNTDILTLNEWQLVSWKPKMFHSIGSQEYIIIGSAYLNRGIYHSAIDMYAEAISNGSGGCQVNSIQRTSDKILLKTSSDPETANALGGFREIHNLVTRAAARYREEGESNNLLSYETVFNASNASHPSRMPGVPSGMDLTDSGIAKLKRSVQSCVFMDDGFVTPHLSATRQKQMAGWFASAINKIKSSRRIEIKIEEITHYRTAGDIINSPCSLRISLPKIDADIIVDSYSFD